VERARIEGRKLSMLVNQSDVETGAVRDDVRAAVRLFFRNDELTVPAGRETIEARIQDAVDRAIMSQAGGLFDEAIDPAAILRAARFATEPMAELSPTERARLLSEAAGGRDVATGRLDAEAARPNDGAAGNPAQASMLDGTNDRTQAAQPAQPAQAQPGGDRRSADPAAQGNQASQGEAGGETASAAGLVTYKGRTFVDTRPENRVFHGTSDATLAPSDTHYSTMNYYGMGFYTTNAVDVAWGYSARGSQRGGRHLFEIIEREPVRFFNAEADLAGTVKEVFDVVKERQTGVDLFDLAMTENPKNLRELYDHIREFSAGEGISADGVQEIFDAIRYTLEELGYGGLEHKGGLRTNAKEHTVKIYWNPETQIELKKIEFSQFEPRAAVAAAEPPSPAPAPENAPAAAPARAQTPSPEDARLQQLATEIGPETRLPFEQADGTMKEMTVTERMAEVDKVKRAAAELNDCIARNGGGAKA